MADPNYIKRLQAQRHKNIMARAKKPLRFVETQLIELMAKNEIPEQMKHCIIKVNKKVQGTAHEKFISASNICAAVFQDHGYMKPGTTVLTGKGLRNNLRHRREVDASNKRSIFESMVTNLWAGYIARYFSDLKKPSTPTPKDEKVSSKLEKLKNQFTDKIKDAKTNVANWIKAKVANWIKAKNSTRKTEK